MPQGSQQKQTALSRLWKVLRPYIVRDRASSIWHGLLDFISKLGSTFYLIIGVVIPWMIGAAVIGMPVFEFWLILGICFLVAGLSMYYSWKQLSDEQNVIDGAQNAIDGARCLPDKIPKPKSECGLAGQKLDFEITGERNAGLSDKNQAWSGKLWLGKLWSFIDLIFNAISHWYGAVYAFTQILLPSFVGLTLVGLTGPWHWVVFCGLLLIGLIGGIHRYYSGYHHHTRLQEALTQSEKAVKDISKKKGGGHEDGVALGCKEDTDLSEDWNQTKWREKTALCFKAFAAFLSYFSGTFFTIASIGLPLLFGISLIALSETWIIVFFVASFVIGIGGGVWACKDHLKSERVKTNLLRNTGILKEFLGARKVSQDDWQIHKLSVELELELELEASQIIAPAPPGENRGSGRSLLGVQESSSSGAHMRSMNR